MRNTQEAILVCYVNTCIAIIQVRSRRCQTEIDRLFFCIGVENNGIREYRRRRRIKTLGAFLLLRRIRREIRVFHFVGALFLSWNGLVLEVEPRQRLRDSSSGVSKAAMPFTFENLSLTDKKKEKKSLTDDVRPNVRWFFFFFFGCATDVQAVIDCYRLRQRPLRVRSRVFLRNLRVKKKFSRRNFQMSNRTDGRARSRRPPPPSAVHVRDEVKCHVRRASEGWRNRLWRHVHSPTNLTPTASRGNFSPPSLFTLLALHRLALSGTRKCQDN